MTRSHYCRARSALLCLSATLASGASLGLSTTPVSLTEDPQIWAVSANKPSFFCTLSSNGSVIGFESQAANLVPGDRNGLSDVFVGAGNTIGRASLRDSGNEAARMSTRPDLSSNGRFLVFLAGDDLFETGNVLNALTAAYHLDLQTGQLLRASNQQSGQTAVVMSDPRISGNGRYVVFLSSDPNIVANDTNNTTDVFRYDTVTGLTVRVSTQSNGAQASNAASGSPAVDSSGDIIAFGALDGDLVAGDSNLNTDIFVKTVSTGVVQRVSLSTTSAQLDRSASAPRLSANGAFVAFESSATNVVPGDTNNTTDVFRVELASGTLVRASEGFGGVQNQSSSRNANLSANGRFVFFDSFGSGVGGTLSSTQLFRKDLSNDQLVPITQISEGLVDTRVNDTGTVACLLTFAALVPEDVNKLQDVYRLDLQTNTFTLKSRADNAIPMPYGNQQSRLLDVDASGQQVLSLSLAMDLDPESFAEIGQLLRSSSAGGDQLATIDRGTGVITRPARIGGNGALPSPPGISNARWSSDASWLVFESAASNYSGSNGSLQVFRQALPAGAPQLISLGTNNLTAGRASNASIADNGNRIAFQSTSSELVVGDTNALEDIFLWDSSTGIRRVSTSSLGVQANDFSSSAEISSNGNRVVFVSHASNLVSNDTNTVNDVFLFDVQSLLVSRISLTAQGAQRTHDSTNPSISPDGRYVVYYNVDQGIPSLQLYDHQTAQTRTIVLPAGVSLVQNFARFGRDPRYLSWIGTNGTAHIAYRYDHIADHHLELYRTELNPYLPGSVPYAINAVRIASASRALVDSEQPLGDFDRNGHLDILAVQLQPGTVQFNGNSLQIVEGSGPVPIPISRSGGNEGAISVQVASVAQTASTGSDFQALSQLVTWMHDDSASQTLSLNVLDDGLQEADETLQVTITNPAGGASLGNPSTVTITILDNDQSPQIFANSFE